MSASPLTSMEITVGPLPRAVSTPAELMVATSGSRTLKARSPGMSPDPVRRRRVPSENVPRTIRVAWPWSLTPRSAPISRDPVIWTMSTGVPETCRGIGSEVSPWCSPTRFTIPVPWAVIFPVSDTRMIPVAGVSVPGR